jgi:hypothetical protein
MAVKLRTRAWWAGERPAGARTILARPTHPNIAHLVDAALGQPTSCHGRRAIDRRCDAAPAIPTAWSLFLDVCAAAARAAREPGCTATSASNVLARARRGRSTGIAP